MEIATLDSRYFNAVDHGLQQPINGLAFELHFRRERDAVTQRWQRDRFDVIRGDELTAAQQRMRARAARTSAMLPRGPAPIATPGQVRVARTMRTE